MGKFDGKVAFVTGGARGQGRSHAVNLAKNGADVVVLDICDQISSVVYPMSTGEDLAETVALVEKEGRRGLGVEGDVRDFEAVEDAVARTVEQFGRLDYVVANAGILANIGDEAHKMSAWHDSIDTMLTGVFHTVYAGVKAIRDGGRGGSMVITGSTASFRGFAYDVDGAKPGHVAYTAAKHGVLGIMREFGLAYGSEGIRVNVVAPMAVRTPMVINQAWQDIRAAVPAGWNANALSVDFVEPQDITEAVLWLLSDEARYVTGSTIPVDSGNLLK